MQVHALIPAAGRGARFGTAENKIFATLNGRAVITRTTEAFLRCTSVDTVTIVGQADELERIRELVARSDRSKPLSYCRGGLSRLESVHLGLLLLSASGAQPDDLVLVHDAARPLISSTLIERCIREAVERGTAIAAYPLSDTIQAGYPSNSARRADHSRAKTSGQRKLPRLHHSERSPQQSTKRFPVTLRQPTRHPFWSMPASLLL